MKTDLVVDTGPLVALLNVHDEHHRWAVEVARTLPAPWLTVETVVSEAGYLLRRTHEGALALLRMVADGALRLPFRLEDHAGDVERLLRRYQNVPMSLADACLVRLTELSRRSVLVTLDRDFLVYRRHRSQQIPLIAPFARR